MNADDWSDADDPEYQPGNAAEALKEMWSDPESDNNDDNYNVYENEFIPDYEHAEPLNSKKNNKKPTRRGQRPEHVLSPEVQAIMDECVAQFANENYEAVIELAEKVITLDPQARRAYQLLAAVYQEWNEMEKVLGLKLTALQLNKKDHEGWVEMGEMSKHMGHIDQAIGCFAYAAKLEEKPDEYVMRSRIELYEMTNKWGRALDLLRKLRKIHKTDGGVLMQMTQCLVEMRRINEAVKLYEDLLQQNKNPKPDDNEEEQVQEFGLSELNIMTELYAKQQAYEKTVEVIKKTARWLADRDEDYWDEYDDDTEYLPKRREKITLFQRGAYKDQPDLYDLPIDIRMKLLMARAKLGDIEEAKMHLEFLEGLEVSDYEDLYLEVGKVFLEVGEPKLALDLFMKRYDALDGDPDFQMAPLISTAHRELNEIDQAEEWLQFLINNGQKEINTRMTLAEMYDDIGRNEEAEEQLEKVALLREEEKEQAKLEGIDIDEIEGRDSSAFIQSVRRKRKQRSEYKNGSRRLTKDERQQQQLQEEQIIKDKYSAYLRLYGQAMKDRNPDAISQLRRRMKEMWEIFSNHKRFFLQDKNKLYKVIIRRGKYFGKGQSIDERIERMASRLKDSTLEDEGPLEEIPTSFRGLGFEEWFDICMRYASIEAVEGGKNSADYALHIVHKCKDANVFHQDEWRREVMEKMNLAVAVKSNNYHEINETVRRMGMSYQLYNDYFRLYGTVFPSGQYANSYYVQQNNQKFIHRQLKAIDQLVHKEKVVGAARVLDPELSLDVENPVVLTLYANFMLQGRSYQHSLSYASRSFNINSKDPLTLFTLALTHIGRALQRQTTNRQLQIMEGLSFMQEYSEIRCAQGNNKGESQEADYNMGRIFHMLALQTFACKYYERVLEYDDEQVGGDEFNLKVNAAYNLQLMYYQAGNKQLAKKMVEKYLVID